eukprot:m.30486 g.30486  ORF g.30486 m.30486 type:complete len:381 (-) comp5226_c0_seq2:145-1287(-)
MHSLCARSQTGSSPSPSTACMAFQLLGRDVATLAPLSSGETTSQRSSGRSSRPLSHSTRPSSIPSTPRLLHPRTTRQQSPRCRARLSTPLPPATRSSSTTTAMRRTRARPTTTASSTISTSSVRGNSRGSNMVVLPCRRAAHSQRKTAGYDVMELMMPLIGCNVAPQYGSPTSHEWFAQWEAKGDHTLRFFIEPVVLAVNYALDVLHYKHVVMVGLSGGGWTTTVAAAVDPRIELSIPIAGSVPKWPTSLYPGHFPDLPEGHGTIGGDYEQLQERPVYNISGFVGFYVLAALEENRHQLQILHEFDSCCFRARGFHADIAAYNRFVQQHAAGWMQTAVTAGNYHMVNLRDKVLVAHLVERLRRNGRLTPADFDALPFDIL